MGIRLSLSVLLRLSLSPKENMLNIHPAGSLTFRYYPLLNLLLIKCSQLPSHTDVLVLPPCTHTPPELRHVGECYPTLQMSQLSEDEIPFRFALDRLRDCSNAVTQCPCVLVDFGVEKPRSEVVHPHRVRDYVYHLIASPSRTIPRQGSVREMSYRFTCMLKVE
jgi:hypothetical protein